jgi:hypothetical protein
MKTIMDIENEIHRLRGIVMFSLNEYDQIVAKENIERLEARLLTKPEPVGPAKPEPVGPYSGLTRAELRQSRTCEPDWY